MCGVVDREAVSDGNGPCHGRLPAVLECVAGTLVGNVVDIVLWICDCGIECLGGHVDKWDANRHASCYTHGEGAKLLMNVLHESVG